MNKHYDKYFVIGFNKTATTTFHELFLKNNLSSRHRGSSSWEVEKYTCFTDNGNNENYKELDLKYENSIFILNTRHLDKWLISRFKHGLSQYAGMFPGFKGKEPNWAYPYTRKLCVKWINDREKFYMEILDYFSKSPNKLIIVNIEREGWINYVCSQLNFKNDNIESKNINKTSYRNEDHKKICELVDKTLEEMEYNKKTTLFPNKELIDKYIKIYNNYI